MDETPQEATTVGLGVPVSLLDVVPVTAHESSAEALDRARDLARLGDRLGFRRLWYAEHHNMPGIGSTAPEVLAANAAALTTRIRVGSGGVMLPNHSPLTVAERYATLDALHPGRIDIGVGRAPGTDRRTALALRRGVGDDDLAELLHELFGYLRGFSNDQPLRGILAYPRPVTMPQVVVLGSSDYGARLAAALGLPYAFAHHFSARFSSLAMRLYREEFQPSRELPTPHAILTVSVICADTDERARELASAWSLSFLRLRAGHPPGPFPTDGEVAAHRWTHEQRAFVDDHIGAQAIGSPDTVQGRLRALIDDTNADELMATTPLTDVAARTRSIEMLAEMAALKPEPVAAR
jgi:luciferase family oxidoreductase group 1